MEIADSGETRLAIIVNIVKNELKEDLVMEVTHLQTIEMATTTTTMDLDMLEMLHHLNRSTTNVALGMDILLEPQEEGVMGGVLLDNLCPKLEGHIHGPHRHGIINITRTAMVATTAVRLSLANIEVVGHSRVPSITEEVGVQVEENLKNLSPTLNQFRKVRFINYLEYSISTLQPA